MMQRVGISIRLAGAVAAAVIAAAGWSGGALAQDTLKFGAPLPLTGGLSPEGKKQQRGYDIWADAVNAKGGIKAGGKTYKVQIVYADYASNTPRAVQTAERMITQDKVSFLFSPFGSGATKAASSVAEKYSIPMLAPSASSEAVYDQNYKFLFGTLSTNSTVVDPMADIITANKAIKRIAILARNDLFPLAIAKVTEASAKKRGLDVVMFERYAIGTMDHAAAITQMRAAKPDWVMATGYINDLVLIRKQMNDLGVKPAVVSMIAGPAYKEFIDAAGPLAENVTSAAWFHHSVRYKGKDIFGSTESFNAAWAKKYNGAEADYIEAASAACGVVLQLAIEAADSVEPKKVRDALAKLNVETFFGPVRFAPNGMITTLEPPVFQIQGGKHVVLYPKAIKQGEIKFLK